MTSPELVPMSVRDELAAHMWNFDFDPPDVHRIADFLMPVVERLRAEAVAEELESIAAASPLTSAMWLREHAAEIREATR